MTSLPWAITGIQSAEEPSGGNKEIPDGAILTVIMDEFEIETKASGAVMANVRYTVTEGEYERFKVWHSMNLVTKSGEPNKISMGQLAWIAKKIGLDEDQAADTHNFLNRPMLIKVGVEKSSDPQYKDKIIPVQWRSLGQSFDERNVGTGTTQQQSPAVKKPAWANV